MKEKVPSVNMYIDIFWPSAFENGIFPVTTMATSALLDFTLKWDISLCY